MYEQLQIYHHNRKTITDITLGKGSLKQKIKKKKKKKNWEQDVAKVTALTIKNM
jgi:hypothetical protein